MNDYCSAAAKPEISSVYAADALRLEGVVTCVGFHDFLDVTLRANHPHFDTLIVVTSHEDEKTQKVAAKNGAVVVVTDLFQKNGRNFNKGAAINAGFNRFQYHGWRMHLDSDILLPDSFRRMLFNHSHLERDCIYGADRTDVLRSDELQAIREHSRPQHADGFILSPRHTRPVSGRYIDRLSGYVPIGYFQLWHASKQREYPYSLGTAAHDDVMFAMQWPESKRRLLPGAICYHLISAVGKMGENWDGKRRQPEWK